MGAFTIDVVVGVYGDQTEFAVPFLPPCLRVDDQVFDAIAPHTPVSTVQVSDPVAALLNRSFPPWAASRRTERWPAGRVESRP